MQAFRGNRALNPAFGTFLIVASVVTAAIVIVVCVYQTGRPKVSPNLATTLEDDERVVLADGQNDNRVAKLTVEGSKNIDKSELTAIVTYTDDNAEYTVVLDGGSWVSGTATAMGTDRIKLEWIDSDGSGDITTGDRLDFSEGGPHTTAGHEVTPGTDFEVRIVHKSTGATLTNHTIKVN